MKDKTLLLLAALAGIAGLGWYLKTQAEAKVLAPATGTTGATLQTALAGTPQKTLLETLAGLMAVNPASPVTPPLAPATTPVPTVPEPSLMDMYDRVRRVGEPKLAFNFSP